MPKEIFEIIFHARAGQGAKTVAQFLVEAALEKGLYVQAWPYYGAERSGAPMQAFARISKKPIKSHAAIRLADAVVVIEPSLLTTMDVTSKLAKDGILIANCCNIQTVKTVTKFQGQIISIDAHEISKRITGKAFPNIAMLGALAKASGLVDIKALSNVLHRHFAEKLGEEMANKNAMMLKEGFEKA